jgi:hypothetical protein
MKAVKTHNKHAYFAIAPDGSEFEIPYEPTESDEVDIEISEDGQRAMVSYLVQDEMFDASESSIDSDIIILQHDYIKRGDEEKFAAALGLVYDGDRTFSEPDPEDYNPEDMPKPDPDAMLIDVYVHSGAYIALSGSVDAARMPDRRWDVSRGVWIPGPEVRKDLDLAATPEERVERREKIALAQIEEWNAINSGDVWGCVLVLYYRQPDGSWGIAEDVLGGISGNPPKHFFVDHEAVWGYVGGEYAQGELKSWCDHWRTEFLWGATPEIAQEWHALYGEAVDGPNTVECECGEKIFGDKPEMAIECLRCFAQRRTKERAKG